MDRAATCGVVTAALEREEAGVKGDLPPAAQERIFHYALLAGADGPQFDLARANAVSTRMPALFDKVVKGDWKSLKPACEAAFPATEQGAPKLPETPLEGLQQCYVLTDYLRKAFGAQGATYAEEANRLGAFATRLDNKLAPMLARAGVRDGDALQGWRSEELAQVAKLGQPSAVMAACEARFS